MPIRASEEAMANTFTDEKKILKIVKKRRKFFFKKYSLISLLTGGKPLQDFFFKFL